LHQYANTKGHIVMDEFITLETPAGERLFRKDSLLSLGISEYTGDPHSMATRAGCVTVSYANPGGGPPIQESFPGTTVEAYETFKRNFTNARPSPKEPREQPVQPKENTGKSAEDPIQPARTLPEIPKTVKIGDQVWTAENLPAEHDPEHGIYVWDGETYFTFDAAVKAAEKYRELGFRLPSREDWQKLVDFCGGADNAGEILKSSSEWPYGANGRNTYGFSGKPYGWYSARDFRPFGTGSLAVFWSSTPVLGIDEAYYRLLAARKCRFNEGHGSRHDCLSVRLIKANA